MHKYGTFTPALAPAHIVYRTRMDDEHERGSDGEAIVADYCPIENN
jgi:hypothetical protein